MKDVGVAGRRVLAGSEYTERADTVVAHDVECTPLAMTLLARLREERHLASCGCVFHIFFHATESNLSLADY